MPASNSGQKTRGILYVTATPIGNLEDITLRALRILKEVSVIACEDTRQTVKILNKFGIKNRLLSYYQPREQQKIPQILAVLKEGKDVALVSDSGTPGISDPGFRLIQEAIRLEIKVIPVPGPTALTAAVSASGLPTHRILFLGFPPPKIQALKKLLLSLRQEESTLIFYLPSRRIPQFLPCAREVLGSRQIVIAREMTKFYEEFVRGSIDEIIVSIEKIRLKGELTLLIQGNQ